MAEGPPPKWWLQSDFERETDDAKEQARVAIAFIEDALKPFKDRPPECQGVSTAQILIWAEKSLKQALAHLNTCVDNLAMGNEVE